MRDEVERLIGHVKRFQRQARRVAFARALGVAAGLTLTVAALRMLAARAESASQWPVLGAATLSAMVIAAVVAWLRTPSLQRTGGAIDHGLKLEDRVVAALQLQQTADVVAALVVSDAVRKLQGTAPEQVFPMRVGWWAAPAVLAAGLVAVAMAIDQSSPRAASPSTGSAGGTGATGVSQAAQGTTTDRPDAPREASASAPRSSAEKADRAIGSAAAASTFAPAGASAFAPGASALAPAGATAAKSAAKSATPVDRAAALGAPASGSEPARGPGDADRPGGSRAGGVGGPGTPGRTIEAVAPTPRSPGSAPTVAAARALAETAMNRGEIPPGFRKHVRDYFTAIQRAVRKSGD